MESAAIARGVVSAGAANASTVCEAFQITAAENADSVALTTVGGELEPVARGLYGGTVVPDV